MTAGRIPSIEGGIQPTIVDAKGDLIAAVAADTPARLAVGANDTVLTADSSTATGLKWAAPTAAGASFTQLALTALSGTTTTISGLSGYNTLWISWIAAGTNTANASVDLRFNADTGDNYRTIGFTLRNADAANTTNMEGLGSDSSRIFVGNQGNSAGNNFSGGLILYGANTTATKVGQMFNGATGQGAVARNGNILYSGTSVISSVSIISSGTFDEGNILVLGSVT
jgi:hypothetical protein